jgi:DNA-binding IclR family transcriptional regulator
LPVLSHWPPLAGGATPVLARRCGAHAGQRLPCGCEAVSRAVLQRAAPHEEDRAMTKGAKGRQVPSAIAKRDREAKKAQKAAAKREAKQQKPREGDGRSA